MSRFSDWCLLSLVVLAWQIEMAVQAGIAASTRPKTPPISSPSKQQAQPPCPTGKCPTPAPTQR